LHTMPHSTIIPVMDEMTIQRLLALNREFYTTLAQPFAATRSVSDSALTSILPYIASDARVLDVGCGNGRLALLLDRERSDTTYVGLDVVPELIELARTQGDRLAATTAEFHVIDITHAGWSQALQDRRFDCGVALAVLHHIPSFDLRVQVLREIACLLAPRGQLILSTWQFLDNARMRRKIVDWAEVSIPPGALEQGDYVLDWKREGSGLRYCHLVDEDEIAALSAQIGFHLHESFRAGGREGDLSLFAILERAAYI
jgi:2-polyprenyl-3-methyl-5-hydroxy-6-metoxy-1,4-benzoquinol methylase